MASLSIQLDKSSYVVGEQVVATLVVTGADPEVRNFVGSVDVDGVTLDATANFTLTHRVENPQAPGATQDAVNPMVFRKTAS